MLSVATSCIAAPLGLKEGTRLFVGLGMGASFASIERNEFPGELP